MAGLERIVNDHADAIDGGVVSTSNLRRRVGGQALEVENAKGALAESR